MAFSTQTNKRHTLVGSEVNWPAKLLLFSVNEKLKLWSALWQNANVIFDGQWILAFDLADKWWNTLVHKHSSHVVMESELPSHTLQYKGGLESRSTSFFQGSLGLIYVASILFWGHFWQSVYAWCQWVKDHEHILFQDHWSRNSHQKNSAGFQVSTESGLQETFF